MHKVLFGNPRTPEEVMRRLNILAIGAGSLLLACIVTLICVTQGPAALVSGPLSEIAYGVGYWVVAGIAAAAILGRMNAAVHINNQTNGCARTTLDQIIIECSCTQVRRGYVVQNQIANLFSGVLGLVPVFVVTQIVGAVTGSALLSSFPQGLLYIFPLVLAWKLLETPMTRFFMRRRGVDC